MMYRLYRQFTPDEFRDVGMLMQQKDSEEHRVKVPGGREKMLARLDGYGDLRDKDADDEGDTFVPQGSIACVSGFLINLVERTLKLISPCYTTREYPYGYRVFAEASFALDDITGEDERPCLYYEMTVKREYEETYRAMEEIGFDSAFMFKYSPRRGTVAAGREDDVAPEEKQRRLAAINAQMSTYLPDSDLMRFNRSRSTDWQQQPLSTVRLVEQANRVSRLTGGRYDITVGPLVDLWGFGSAGSRTTPPSQKEIDLVREQIGYARLHTRIKPPALCKEIESLQIDLSSIAKGWAVDQLAMLLKSRGFDDFLV